MAVPKNGPPQALPRATPEGISETKARLGKSHTRVRGEAVPVHALFSVAQNTHPMRVRLGKGPLRCGIALACGAAPPHNTAAAVRSPPKDHLLHPAPLVLGRGVTLVGRLTIPKRGT